MKTEWHMRKLSQVATINYGYTESATFDQVGPKFLRITDIQNGAVDWTAVPYCKIDKEEGARFRLATGDIVFARTGATTGKSFLIREPPDAVFASYLIRLRLISQELTPEFVALFFQTESYWRSITEGSSGSAQGGFNASKLGSLSIPVPAVKEQRRIVAILDEAFASLTAARANAERNLQNAQELFESELRVIFSQPSGAADQVSFSVSRQGVTLRDGAPMMRKAKRDDDTVARVTRTGGREATVRHIAGELSLSVGMPKTAAKAGWKWKPLADVGRLESGHTPSRKHPEYWGGQIPWIGIQDARENHGRTIFDTNEHTNAVGIDNSSARVLPAGTVCLSRTASVGYVVVMGKPMATSQDFVNWVCSEALLPDFLKYIFIAEGRHGLLRYASGAVHQTIYFPEAKAFWICHPDTVEQARIVKLCDDLSAEIKRLASIYERKLVALAELRQSLLREAFSGKL